MKLMPAVATSFGRVLGPVGKMPSPQLGVLTSEDEDVIKALLVKINPTVRVRVKEPSIKIGIAKDSLSDDQIVKNAFAVYQRIQELLPRKIDNIRNIKIKFTMGKPVNVEI
jgi:ribosomal protein L1